MRYSLKGHRRVRVGDYRVAYRIDGEAHAVNVIKPAICNVLAKVLPNTKTSRAKLLYFIQGMAAASWCVRCVRESFLIIVNPSRKARRYPLAVRYEALDQGGRGPLQGVIE